MNALVIKLERLFGFCMDFAFLICLEKWIFCIDVLVVMKIGNAETPLGFETLVLAMHPCCNHHILANLTTWFFA